MIMLASFSFGFGFGTECR